MTEGALLHLARRFPSLLLHKFNQSEEKSTGGDWEWFVGSRRGWIAFRIQAKRMDGLQYRQLSHDGQLAGERQYDTLIRDSAAAAVPTFPFHVFFNGWSSGWPTGVPWNACPNGRLYRDCAHHAMTDMGCSLLPATTVRDLHRSSGRARLKVATYLPTSVPWSWLFGPPIETSLSGSAGRRPPIRDLDTLVAWHVALAQALGPGSSYVDEQDAGSGPSTAGVLARRWFASASDLASISDPEPALRLPIYAAWALGQSLRQRIELDRSNGEFDEAWHAIAIEASDLAEEEARTFATPPGLNGVIFSPLLEQ